MDQRVEMSQSRAMIALCLASLAALIGFAVLPAMALGVEEHAFDRTLSLGGNCNVSSLDEAPDPGLCPMPPGIPGVDHPLKSFDISCGTTIDFHGDIYVSNAAVGNGTGTEGRIDVFNSKGEFLTEIQDSFQPCSIAVDSKGNVYAQEYAGKDIVRFDPNSFPPIKGAGFKPRHVVLDSGSPFCKETTWGVAVDPSNDHLFISDQCAIAEYDSAANGNLPLKAGIAEGLPGDQKAISIRGANHDLYTTGLVEGTTGIFVLDGSDYSQTKCAVKGLGNSHPDVAVDQANGDFYVDDVTATTPKAVRQFDSGCAEMPAGNMEHSFEPGGTAVHSVGLAVDDPMPGQVGYDSPNEGNVYVAQGSGSKSHLYAFRPKVVSPPEVAEQIASEITETDGTLSAELSPGGKATTYHFEYITVADFQKDGQQFGAEALSVPVPDSEAGEESAFSLVSEPLTGLAPDTNYRFRLVASNCEAPGEEGCTTKGEGKPGEEGKDATFSTYPAEGGLVDGRAYELVTPPDTNGRTPTMAELAKNNPDGFDTALTSPKGESLVFGVRGGALPELGGGGFNDTYLAVRNPVTGWQSHFTGLDGSKAESPYAGGVAADHSYSFWRVEHNRGSFPEGNYLRTPNGTFESIGIGELGEDPYASGKWITSNGDHVIFVTESSAVGGTPIQLEQGAPPSGIGAIYDRTPGGATKVLSLPPQGASEATQKDFEEHNASFRGVSVDGTAVAFEVNGTLYLRQDGADETLVVGTQPLSFAGVSGHGERVFYLRPNLTEPTRPNPPAPKTIGVPQGEIFAYDTDTGTTDAIGTGNESVFVNMAPDGSSAYFVSPEELNGGAEGEIGGAENLYAWSATANTTHLVAVLTERDVVGEPAAGSTAQMTDGLGLWVAYAMNPIRSEYQGLGADPSRTSADAAVIVFESRAKLTEYENGGQSEIYRYDGEAPAAEQLTCVSCNPTMTAAESDALLQTPPAGQFSSFPPTNDLGRITNVTDDGKMVFFQSGDQLVPRDVDGKIDVYEWEAQGTGGCAREAGCIHLISSGHSAGDDYLYAVTPDGSDVFFETGDTLVPQDPDKTPSIYDARSPHVPGEAVGFPPPSSPPAPCLGEACQPAPVVPIDATPASSNFQGSGNPKPPKKSCPKKKAHSSKKAKCSGRHKSSKKHGKRKPTNGDRRATR